MNCYDIYRNGSWYSWTSSTSYTNTGLTNGTAYSYTVSAQNDTTTPVTTFPQSASRSCTPIVGNGGGNTGGFVVSEAQFNQMFPNRNSFYTYAGLVSAMASFPPFAKREAMK